jgi:hypothetical protein
MRFKEFIKVKPKIKLPIFLSIVFCITTGILIVQNWQLVRQNANQKTYIEASRSATPVTIYKPQPTPFGTLSTYGTKRLFWIADGYKSTKLTIKDDKTGVENILMKNPPSTIDWSFKDNWSPDGNYILVKLTDKENNNNFLIFKADGTTFTSGQNYITSESLGLTDSHFFYISWVGGGGFVGNVISINSVPAAFIKNSFIDMDQKTIQLTPKIPSGHALD